MEEFTEGSREVDIMVTEVMSNLETVTLDPPVIEVLFRVPLSQYQQAISARDFFASVSYDKLLDDTPGEVLTYRDKFPPLDCMKRVQLGTQETDHGSFVAFK